MVSPLQKTKKKPSAVTLKILESHARTKRARAALPEPMPARDKNGERVWLHYSPLRWERKP